MGWDIRKADLAVGGCRRAVKTAGVYTLSSHEREGENSAPLTLGHLLWGSLPGRAGPLKGLARLACSATNLATMDGFSTFGK